MSESIIGDESWDQMTEAEKTEVVRTGRATFRQLTQGLLDGPTQLRDACRRFLSKTGAELEEFPLNPITIQPPPEGSLERLKSSAVKERRVRTVSKPRFGLPQGFMPRLQRHGRAMLLEDNIYRLPNEQEFVPVHPTGVLGKLQHLYALLTLSQEREGQRGSIYVRIDGRIFDYSLDGSDPERELFDTGYTIYDLERTGRYTAATRVQERTKSERIKGKSKAVRA